MTEGRRPGEKAHMELRPYQAKAVGAVMRRLAAHRTAMVVMATGTGKTVVFAEVARRWQGADPRPVLVLAHRRELVDQARRKLGGVRCDVMTVQGLSRRLDGIDPEAYGLVVIDECHHSHAKSYERVIRRLSGAHVLGVTATPERTDGRSLVDLFGTPAFEYCIAQGVADGWLSPIRIEPTPLRIDLSGVGTARGDYVQAQLGKTVEPWLDAAARWIRDNAADRRTVVFLPLVSTAKKMAAACERVGLVAAEVDGESPDRARTLADFAEGRCQVLCNAMLLTEGWDCPEVGCVMVLRPTKSRALYCQMVGRGTRLAEGKADLLVPDVLAFGDEPIMRPWDMLGKEPPKAAAKRKNATRRAPVVADREGSLARRLDDGTGTGGRSTIGQPRRKASGGADRRRESFVGAVFGAFVSGFKDGFREGWGA